MSLLTFDPLNTAYHPEEIVNIVSGKTSKAEVNVQNSVAIGTAQMEEFE